MLYFVKKLNDVKCMKILCLNRFDPTVEEKRKTEYTNGKEAMNDVLWMDDFEDMIQLYEWFEKWIWSGTVG